MADLNLELIGEVIAACKAGTSEAAEAFGRALDVQMELSVGTPGGFDLELLPSGFEGPGLAVVLVVESSSALLLLPESTGILPSWCESPDATGQAKLTTLAQELGMVLLPEQVMPDDFKAARVASLVDAVARGGVENGAALVPLEISTADGRQGTATLVWPAPHPEAVLQEPAPATSDEEPKTADESPAVSQPPAADSQPPVPGAASPPAPPRKLTIDVLPDYTRSLLRVSVPVVVTLADKRQRLSDILELGPGSIIHFEKSCEEMLDLAAGGHQIASGEAVKVGDKFGLRITSVKIPDERFRPVRK